MSKYLPKYARRYIDDFTNYICNTCGIKKKDVEALCNKNDISDLFRSLNYKTTARKRMADNRCFAVMGSLVDTLYSFNKGLHFCVANPLKDKSPKSYDEYDWKSDIYVDFSYGGHDFFVHAWKCKYPVKFNNFVSDYMYTLYGDIPEMFDYNYSALDNQYGMLWKFTAMYKLHICDKHKYVQAEISDANKWLMKNLHWSYTLAETESNKAPKLDADIAKATFDNLGVPTPEYVYEMVNHVIYCYLHRDTLKRKNGKAQHRYNNCSVHVASTGPKDSDVYVPLLTYAQTHRSTEYKGGHHASPTGHDRRGFYRKSRGRGDYDLVDGKIVYVGDMKGKYSYVSPTHVEGNKNKTGVKIYKS